MLDFKLACFFLVPENGIIVFQNFMIAAQRFLFR